MKRRLGMKGSDEERERIQMQLKRRGLMADTHKGRSRFLGKF